MANERLEITVISVENRLFDVDEAARLTRIHPELIMEFERGHLVERRGTGTDDSPLFDEAGLCRLRILSDLREREKLSLRMTKVVCRLMDRLERAESEVRRLRNGRQ